MKTRISNIDSVRGGGGEAVVEMIDTVQKAKHKEYADKRPRARDQKIYTGDQALLKKIKP